jgi:hypothetical protein
MSDFLKRIEELKQNSLTCEKSKIAAEVLLSSIKIDNKGADVYPANCPGKGRAQDILLDVNGSAACMFNGQNCPYFVSTEFSLEQYDKNIICKVI